MAGQIPVSVAGSTKKRYDVPFRFAPVSTDAPTDVNGRVGWTEGEGIKSITRTDTGTYRVTFTSPHQRVLTALAGVRNVSGLDADDEVICDWDDSAGYVNYVDVYVYINGTLADLAYDDNSVVHGLIVCDDNP
jgi:hypothetical protein